MLKTLLTVAVLSSSSYALSPDENPSIVPHTVIAIERYNPGADTYNVIITTETGVGPNLATPEDLARSISTIKLEKIKQHPQSIVGNDYEVEQRLRLLSWRGVHKRMDQLKGSALKKKQKN